MPSGRQALINPESQNPEKGQNENVGGYEERHPGFAHAAQVNQRNQGQYPNTERDDEFVKLGNRGDERSNACGNANGYGKDVVDKQSRSCEQAGVVPKFSLATV